MRILFFNFFYLYYYYCFEQKQKGIHNREVYKYWLRLHLIFIHILYIVYQIKYKIK